MTVKNELHQNVLAIVNELESCSDLCEWLEDVMDIEWHLHSDMTFKNAKLLVSFGGPNIWVNTSGYVEGYWGGESFTMSFDDNFGIADFYEDMFACK